MAYNPRNLSVLAYANGFTLWHYTSADDFAAVTSPGYFNTAADMLRQGDEIRCNLSNCEDFAVLWVRSSEAGAISVCEAGANRRAA